MDIELKYIEVTDKLYRQAKQIRIECFFNEMNNKEELINDKFEKDAIHLVCLNKNQHVIGTGRVNTAKSVGVISQMAIKKENQKTGIGQKILSELIRKCESLGIQTIELSARESALDFYRKSGFKTLGNKYPSIKTGIIHQKMTLNIKNIAYSDR